MMKSHNDIEYQEVDIEEDPDSRTPIETRYGFYQKVRQIWSKLTNKISDDTKKKPFERTKASNRLRCVTVDTKYDCYEKVRQILSELSKVRSDETEKEQIEKMKVSKRFKKILEGYTLPDATGEREPDYYVNVQTFLLKKCKNEIFFRDEEEKIFFAAALLQQDEVDASLDRLKGVKLDYVRDGKTVIHFILKYGNLGNSGIVRCVQTFVDAGVDLDVCDFNGYTVLDQVLRLYQISCREEEKQNLKDIAQVLADSDRCYIDENARGKLKEMMDIEAEAVSSPEEVAEITRIFNLVTKKNHEDLEKICSETAAEVLNSNNGEDTLLQLACKKKHLETIECLLKHGADPNQSTAVNPSTPLEFCALRNYKKSFASILNSTDKLTEEQFHSFVRKRARAMKTFYFNRILESEKLDHDHKFETNHNTPLHYAIFLSQKNAIQKLLKRGASLSEKNSSGRAPLHYIDHNDLEAYFDSCIILDKHKAHISDPSYKIQFDFGCFFASKKTGENSREFCEDGDEWKVIYQIGENKRLQNLLKHPSPCAGQFFGNFWGD